MPSAGRRRISRQHYDVDATITPETGFKLSLTQMLLVIVAVFTVAVGYGYLVWGQQSTSAAVADIKTVQTTAVVRTTEAIKEQDEKRTALGRQFIESNEKIATAVSLLATQMAVQQERQKTTDDKLEKVLIQIGTALQRPEPAHPR